MEQQQRGMNVGWCSDDGSHTFDLPCRPLEFSGRGCEPPMLGAREESMPHGDTQGPLHMACLLAGGEGNREGGRWRGRPTTKARVSRWRWTRARQGHSMEERRAEPLVTSSSLARRMCPLFVICGCMPAHVVVRVGGWYGCALGTALVGIRGRVGGWGRRRRWLWGGEERFFSAASCPAHSISLFPLGHHPPSTHLHPSSQHTQGTCAWPGRPHVPGRAPFPASFIMLPHSPLANPSLSPTPPPHPYRAVMAEELRSVQVFGRKVRAGKMCLSLWFVCVGGGGRAWLGVGRGPQALMDDAGGQPAPVHDSHTFTSPNQHPHAHPRPLSTPPSYRNPRPRWHLSRTGGD